MSRAAFIAAAVGALCLTAAVPAPASASVANSQRAILGGTGYLNLHQCSYTTGARQQFTNFMPNTSQPGYNTGTNTSPVADTKLSCGPGRSGWQPFANNSGFKAFNLKGSRYLNLHQCVYRTAAGETATNVLPNVPNSTIRAATNVSNTIDDAVSCGPGNTEGYYLDSNNSSVKTYDLLSGKFLNLHQCVYTNGGYSYTNLQPNTANTNFNTGTNISDTRDTASTCGNGGNGWSLKREYSTTLAMPVSRSWMCYDIGSAAPSRGDRVTIRECANQNSQRLVVEGGQIKVQTTLGSAQPLCLDVPNRNVGQQAMVWSCSPAGTNSNQQFRIQNGQIKVVDTLGNAQPLCLDFGTAFDDGDPVTLQTCAANGQQNPGQDVDVRRGFIMARATL